MPSIEKPSQGASLRALQRHEGEFTVTFTVPEPPKAEYDAAGGLSETVQVGRTSACTVPLTFLYVALTSTLPSAAAVRMPDGETEAIVGADDCQAARLVTSTTVP